MMALELLKGGIFAALLFVASVTDIRSRVIPNTLCFLIACTGLVLFEPSRLFGLLVCVPFLVAALFSNGMGGGDVKLAAAMGFVLGFANGIAAIIIGLTVQFVFYIGYFCVRKMCGAFYRKAFPLAPFFAFGGITVTFLNIGGII